MKKTKFGRTSVKRVMGVVCYKLNIQLAFRLVILFTTSVITYVLISQEQILYGIFAADKELSHNIFNNNTQPLTPLKLGTRSASQAKEWGSIPHRTYLISRTPCTQTIFLLIVVASAPGNFDTRAVIRRTWGSDMYLEKRWTTVFLIGQAKDRNQNDYLDAEAVIYGDVIRGSHNDHYYNLTLKTQIGIEWAARYCDFKFLLKVDDDVFVSPRNLIGYLKRPETPNANLYMGYCFYNAPVYRFGRYGVSKEEYNKARYPDYCNGPAYLLSSDLVDKLAELLDTKNVFKMEDVYVGLLLENIGGVKATHHSEFLTRRHNSCSHFPNMFAYHNSDHRLKCLEELFEQETKKMFEYELNELSKVNA